MEPNPRHDESQAKPSEAIPAGPARDLGDIWQLLDALPPASAGVDLAATTVDLVAAKVAGAARDRERERVGLGRWIISVAAVIAALVGGLVVGRATAPDPDHWVLENLPVIEHVGLLREAGSVAFLEALAERMNASQGPPRWLRSGRDLQSLRDEAREFDAALAKLEAEETGQGPAGEQIVARRDSVAALPAAKKADLERAAETFRGLSRIDRRELAAVAAALADPTNRQLRDAARMWHVILAAMNPVFRRTVIEMPAEERLEMLERSPGRPRDEFRDRRPAGEGGNADRWPPPGPAGSPSGGPPRPVRPAERPQGVMPGPPGFRFPPRAGADPPEAPAETRAPPR